MAFARSWQEERAPGSRKWDGAVTSVVVVPGGRSVVAVAWMLLLGVCRRDRGWSTSSTGKENRTRGSLLEWNPKAKHVLLYENSSLRSINRQSTVRPLHEFFLPF